MTKWKVRIKMYAQTNGSDNGVLIGSPVSENYKIMICDSGEALNDDYF